MSENEEKIKRVLLVNKSKLQISFAILNLLALVSAAILAYQVGVKQNQINENQIEVGLRPAILRQGTIYWNNPPTTSTSTNMCIHPVISPLPLQYEDFRNPATNISGYLVQSNCNYKLGFTYADREDPYQNIAIKISNTGYTNILGWIQADPHTILIATPQVPGTEVSSTNQIVVDYYNLDETHEYETIEDDQGNQRAVLVN